MKVTEVVFQDGSREWFQASLQINEDARVFVITLPGEVHIFPFESVRRVCEMEKAESRA